MNCEDYRKKFDLYVDEELKPREAFELETHLKTCFHCKAELGVIQRTVRLIGELNPLIPPKGFDKGVLMEMGFEIAPPWRRAVSITLACLAGGWVILFIPWIIRSLRVVPGLAKSLLQLPAKSSLLVEFTQSISDSLGALVTTGSIILRNIPYTYGLSMVVVSLLLTLVFTKSMTILLKEANHVHNSH
jgi:predicted anti-sigma-YlaC factor YlaD